MNKLGLRGQGLSCPASMHLHAVSTFKNIYILLIPPISLAHTALTLAATHDNKQSITVIGPWMNFEGNEAVSKDYPGF